MVLFVVYEIITNHHNQTYMHVALCSIKTKHNRKVLGKSLSKLVKKKGFSEKKVGKNVFFGPLGGGVGKGFLVSGALGPRWKTSVLEEDYDDDDSAAGDSDAEVTVVIEPAVEQRSGLDDGAEKKLALESGATVVWRKPKNKKSSLRAFFLQGTEKGKKRAKCAVEGCKKPIVMAQATSNLLQHMAGHNKRLPAFAYLLEYSDPDPPPKKSSSNSKLIKTYKALTRRSLTL